MPTYPNLVRYIERGQRLGPLKRIVRKKDGNFVPLGIAAVGATLLSQIAKGLLPGLPVWRFAVYLFSLVLACLFIWNAQKTKAMPKATPEELGEMERGAAAWHRISAALELAAWTAPEVGEPRRLAVVEIREAGERAMQRLVRDPMTREDRAWLAFGLERLADEVEKPPPSSTDPVGYAIHNRQALRTAGELLRQRNGA